MRWLCLLLGSLCLARASSVDEFLAAAKDRHGPEGESAARFLIEHMPARDKASLSSAVLLENLTLALQSRKEFPWSKDIPDDIFLNEHAIYATSWKRAGLAFPMVWAKDSQEVSAVNVTPRYAQSAPAQATRSRLGVRLWDRKGGQRLVAKTQAFNRFWVPLGSAETRAGTADLNDMPRFELDPGASGWLLFQIGNQTRELAFGPLIGSDPTVDAIWELLQPAAIRKAAATCAAPSTRPVQVFVLAGQSNMEGQAVVDLEGKDYNGGKGTLLTILKDPTKGASFRHLRDDKGGWVERSDVQVRYQPQKGPLKLGPLAPGFTPYEGAHHFGPELQFGHVLGDHLENPVLLVKTAWGGKSLYSDFRPPSSGGTVGPYFLRMVNEVRAALTNLAVDFPGWDGNGFELAGLVWYHGWNDGVRPDVAVPEYEKNLVNLIDDFRKAFEAPKLPVVIGEMTGPWREAPGAWDLLRKAQAAAASRPEFQGTVRFVETHDFVQPPDVSPNPTHGHHEFGNAETYLRVGDALGRAMIQLLPKSPR